MRRTTVCLLTVLLGVSACENQPLDPTDQVQEITLSYPSVSYFFAGESLPIELQALDAQGKPVVGARITIKALYPGQPGTGTMSDTLVITNAEGLAQVEVALGPTTGSLHVAVTSPKLVPAPWIPIDVIGPAHIDVIRDTVVVPVGGRQPIGIVVTAGTDTLYRPTKRGVVADSNVALLGDGWSAGSPGQGTFEGSAIDVIGLQQGITHAIFTVRGSSTTADTLVIQVP